MDEAAKARLELLARLWRREREASRERTARDRRELPLAERVARGVAARDLVLQETDAAPGGRIVAWLVPNRRPAANRRRLASDAGGGPPSVRTNELELLRAGSGDPVRLWREKPEGPDAIAGVVSRKREGRIAVMVDADALDALDAGPLNLDRDDPEVTFDRGDAAIVRFRDAKAGSDEARLRDAMLGARAPRYAERKDLRFLDAALNDPQREAIAHAMSASEVALVHGPPGTGKTRTLVEVVRQSIARGERVLVTAASNAAVDNLSAQLVETNVPVVRIGHPARVSPAMEARTLDALLEASGAFALARQWHSEAIDRKRRARMRLDRGQIRHHELRDELREANALHRDARQHLAGAQDAILSGAKVIAATAAGADSSLLGDLRFDLVVLDEATQAPDPLALVALARGTRAVLAGDPCQLPPTVIDPGASREGLGETIFERLADSRPETCRMLVVQHRMHEALMAFPSASMYGGRLVAHASVARHRLEDLPGVGADPERPGPWHLLDASGRGWGEERGADDPSTRNPGLAARVAEEARRVLARGLPPADLAIISMYDAQVRLLRDLLAPEVSAGLEIGSVDGFQGREKEAVIVDLVRSNDEGEIGFLADTRRMNVALTRARRWLLVAGDGATLGGHPFYRAFLEHAEKSGAWLSAWT